jgi:hypothetical protein
MYAFNSRRDYVTKMSMPIDLGFDKLLFTLFEPESLDIADLREVVW